MDNTKRKNFKIIKDFYRYVKMGDKAKAIAKGEEILKISDQQYLTVYKDTILHIAIYLRRESIAKEVLKKYRIGNLPITTKNEQGDTVLHESAAANMMSLTNEILKEAPKLLHERNCNGETPLFRAALYGRTEMFDFLADEIASKPGDLKNHYERKNGETILHMTILAEFYDLALKIAERYTDWVNDKDRNQMIGLQLLSSNPSAFKSSRKYGLLERFIYYCAPSSQRKEAIGFDPFVTDSSDNYNNDKPKDPKLYTTRNSELSKINRSLWRCLQVWPVMRRIYNEKKRHESAFELAKFLIKRDFSWEFSSPIGYEDVNVSPEKGGEKNAANNRSQDTTKTGSTSDQEKNEGTTSEEKTPQPSPPPTSLLIATSKGIFEIVQEILSVYPQAVEHVSGKGQNILHVAIQNRQLEIFRYVKNMGVPLARLVRRIDKDGHTILHHAGVNHTGASKLAPALQLQEELRWFERVKKITPSHYEMHRCQTRKGLTAQELFDTDHGELLNEAKEWLKRTSESCSTVAVLIATVAFAAAYTVPGGSDQVTGAPVLLGDTFFLAFTITDVLSLASSLTSVVMFLSILTSPFRLQDFRRSLPRKLQWGFIFLFFSVAATMLSFAATIMLIVHLKKQWTTWLIYTAAFLPVTIFAILQFPWFLASRSTFKFFLKLIKKVLPKYCFQKTVTDANQEAIP